MEGKSHGEQSPWARAGRGNTPWRGMDAGRAEGRGAAGRTRSVDGRGIGAKRTARRLRSPWGVAGVLVVMAVAAAALFLVRPDAGGTPDPEAARPAKAAGASSREPVPAPKPAAGRPALAKPPAAAPGERLESASDGAGCGGAAPVGKGPERGWLVGAVTNADGGVVERWRLEDGRRMKRVRPPRRVFAHPTDELIAMALSGEEASEPPPLPSFGPGAEAAFRASLGTPVEDLPGDDAAAREAKRRVREARAEIARRMDAGETFAEVLASHVAARAELARERAARVARESGGDDARAADGGEGEKEGVE